MNERDDFEGERKRTLSDSFGLPDDAADSVARDRQAPQPTRKPASNDVENERIAEAQRAARADEAS